VRGQDKYQQVCELQHNPAGLPALATRGQPSLLSSTVTAAAPRGYERWWHLPSAYRHMFCIDSRRQIEGTSDGLERFGADNVRVQIDYGRQKMFGRVAAYVDMLYQATADCYARQKPTQSSSTRPYPV
jgi:hypothetical protein